MSSYFWRRLNSMNKNRPTKDPVNRTADYEKLELRQLLAADVLAISADNIWQQMDQDIAVVSVGRNLIKAEKFGLYDLQEQVFFELIAKAPLEFTPGYEANLAVLTVPTPDGGFERFAITEAPIMAADLAAEFPTIRTFRGQGIDQPAATIRLDYTELGFHAQILSPDGQYYVDPYFHLQTDLYMSYYVKDLFVDVANANYSEALYSDTGEFLYGSPKQNLGNNQGGGIDNDDPVFGSRASVGDIPDDNVSPGTTPPGSSPLEFAPDFGSQLRTYETAVAATGEYTQFWGGTVNSGMSAVVTAINRVTGIYENDLAVRMELVANNSSIIYTNGATDPYTNNNGFAMLSQNQSNLDSVIGNSNYDVGHVFSTGGGGVALLGVIGQAGVKAQGVTGLPSPVGDPFYVDFVAHELGHQFGGNHSFNGDSGSCAGGNRNASTAYEPGSGSTIQAYAGICGNDNLQNNSDAMFHSISIDEIRTEVTTGSGGAAATLSNTGNTVPVVSAGADYIIPDQTPFELTAVGSDADGNNSLTYSWEQRDLGPQRDVNASDNGSSPIFRTWLPATDPTRVFPRMQNVLNGTTVKGEQYPTTNWTSMDFRVVLRDNNSGGGGVVSDDMRVRVVNSGPGFDLTSQSTSTSWTGLGTETITWNVSGTDSGLINTPNVDIYFALDGFDYDIVVATGVPNDGSQVIEVPNVDTTTGRIKVRGSGNVFFDVNRANISVVSVTPPPGGCGDIVHIGDTRFGVAAADNATGTGYMMYSEESVHTRFSQINTNNADKIIAVRFNGSQWQYNNNTVWVNFTPVASDRLLADVDFSADTVTSLQGTSSNINGIEAGYVSGDIVITANTWNGSTNAGEFGVSGTFFSDSAVGDIPITPINFGIAVADDATGTGYIMYTAETVASRFGNLNSNNAEHLLAVRLNGSQWQYNNNNVWINFTSVVSDRLLADVDFSADTVTSLQGTSSTINGIQAGYVRGDVAITANMWNGSSNTGEFGVTGTFFSDSSAGNIPITPINFGIAVADGATGTGYMMYTVETVANRFSGLTPNNAEHLVAVRLNGGQWQFNNNTLWVDFTSVASDRLLADVDFTADTVTSLQGTSSTVSGIEAGYVSGDIVITANMWNGSSNAGEFGVTGTFFSDSVATDTIITPINFGIAVADGATGTGYIMYTTETVGSRFSDLTPNNAEHLVAVRLNGGQWQYNNNTVWVDFIPAGNDRLLADVDFSADTVTSLQGTSSTINGIQAGYDNGDIVITANMWNGSPNAGEFGVTGTFFGDCPSNRPGGGGGFVRGGGNDGGGGIDGSDSSLGRLNRDSSTADGPFSKFLANADLNYGHLPSLQFGAGPEMEAIGGAQLATLAGAIFDDLNLGLDEGFDSIVFDAGIADHFETVLDGAPSVEFAN